MGHGMGDPQTDIRISHGSHILRQGHSFPSVRVILNRCPQILRDQFDCFQIKRRLLQRRAAVRHLLSERNSSAHRLQWECRQLVLCDRGRQRRAYVGRLQRRRRDGESPDSRAESSPGRRNALSPQMPGIAHLAGKPARRAIPARIRCDAAVRNGSYLLTIHGSSLQIAIYAIK